MGRSHIRVIAVVAAAFSIVASACGATSPAGASPSAAGGTPVKGGTLVMAIWQEPANLMPHYAQQTVQSVVLDTVVEGLTSTAPNGDYTAVLAKEVPTVGNGLVKVSTDGKTMDVTYDLKPGLKWSDGQPVTSADVKFTWQIWVSDPKTSVKSGYDLITGIDTPDDNTAIVHYKQVYPAYPTKFTRLLAKHALEKDAADPSKSDYVRKPLGTGPFMVTEFKAGDSFTVERNPYYREAGKPYLDKIIFKSVPSSTVAIAQLKAGEVQAMWNLLESESADVEKASGVKIDVTPGPSVERIEFNTAENTDSTDPNSKHPVLGDINVRRALIYATPKQQIIDKLLFGKATVGTTVLSTGWAAPKDVTQESYDPKKANDLLDQAGWVKGADGIRAKNGVKASLTITTTTGNATREQVEQVLVQEWKNIGVELKIANVPSAVLLSASWTGKDPRKRGTYDLSMYASSPDIDPDSIVYERYYSKRIPYAGNNGEGQNYTRVKNPDLDKAIEDSRSTLDLDKRKTAYSTALKLLNQEAVIDWLYNRADISGLSDKLHGFVGNPWRNISDSAGNWWLSK